MPARQVVRLVPEPFRDEFVYPAPAPYGKTVVLQIDVQQYAVAKFRAVHPKSSENLACAVQNILIVMAVFNMYTYFTGRVFFSLFYSFDYLAFLGGGEKFIVSVVFHA